MMKKLLITALVALSVAVHTRAADDPTLQAMKTELQRNFEKMSKVPDAPAYYISYRLEEPVNVTLVSFNGAPLEIQNDPSSSQAIVSVRIGDYKSDNTKEMKLQGGMNVPASISSEVGINPSPDFLKYKFWEFTDKAYKASLNDYNRIKSESKVVVESEDKSDDFSKEKRETYFEPVLNIGMGSELNERLQKIVAAAEAIVKNNKNIHLAQSIARVSVVRKYFVDSEGASIAHNNPNIMLMFVLQTTAEDGMNLSLYPSYQVAQFKDLPTMAQIEKDLNAASEMLSKLREAPVADTYSGPAILSNKVTGVFFHEFFGHRIEGARLKQETDAQTFKKKLNEKVLPSDLSVTFDPSIDYYDNIPMIGGYKFDDEGVRGQRVEIVKDGVLKSFLMSRRPIDSFSNSNGHGRAASYSGTVTRQSNMIITTSAPKTNAQLRAMLIEELKKEKKEYGYWFEEVSGGFTMTNRYMPNAFNVSPLIVYKVFVDGRPDQLVRGVNLIGTPMSVFSQIIATGNENGFFNGTCGAESGGVPVSTISPAMLLKQIETQKAPKSFMQPPLLERP